jgi:outer membrane protein OmpA-like peptidoglycan-associated protein
MNPDDYGTSSSTSTATTRTRRWIRRDFAVMPLWHGLLPLLGLLLLLLYAFWPFANNIIEEQVHSQTQNVLEKSGNNWVQMAVSGQHVTLSGTPPTEGAGDAALAAARQALCPTWLGLRLCSVHVTGAFDQVAKAVVPPVAAKPAPAPTPAPEPAPAIQQAAQCETSLAALLANRKIEFATNKATVLPASYPLLDEIAKTAKDCPGVIEVQGHTDSIGQAAANLKLSQARARAVAGALQERGFDTQRLKAVGFGLTKPIADNKTAQGRAQNRRIEFRVVAN